MIWFDLVIEKILTKLNQLVSIEYHLIGLIHPRQPNQTNGVEPNLNSLIRFAF